MGDLAPERHTRIWVRADAIPWRNTQTLENQQGSRLDDKVRIVIGKLRIVDCRCRSEPEYALAIAVEICRALVITKAHWRAHYERLDHGEAGEVKHSVIDRKEDRRDWTVQPVFPIHRRLAADGDRAHRPLPDEDAAVIPLAAAVDATPRSEDSIDPALEDHREPEPPEEKLQDQNIAPEQLVHLRLDVGRKPVMRGGMGLFSLLALIVRAVDGRKISAVRHWVEAQNIEVRYDELVPGGCQRFRGFARHSPAKAARLRVGMNDKNPRVAAMSLEFDPAPATPRKGHGDA